MALIGQKLANTRQFTNVKIIANGFHASSTWLLDQGWRQKNRLTKNPNAFGPLTNLPDYSYADGRPAPFGVRQWGRITRQREILVRMKKLVHEIDYAVERHARIETEKAENRRMIIEGKFKRKGQCLLSESNKKN